MMTVHEVGGITGVSARTLHHYDRIGLLLPTEVTDAGYRLYDEAALERLRHILVYRELSFSLGEIKSILDSSDFDRDKALEQQIYLLELRRERLGKLIELAREIKKTGVNKMSFEAFDTKKIDEYAAKAKAAWGNTEAYAEYEKKSAGRSTEARQRLNIEMMEIFRELGEIREQSPASDEAILLVKKLQSFITDNYYNCTDDIFLSLGKMYACGGEFTENIDKVGGKGTGEFACKAIEAMLAAKK